MLKFSSLFSLASLSVPTLQHMFGKTSGLEFSLFPVLCDGICCQAVKSQRETTSCALLQAVVCPKSSTNRTYILSSCQVPREVPILVHHALGQLLEIPC